MALPTLQPYWMKHYKNKTEQFHVQRTQHDSDFRNKWDENSRYFQRSSVEATKKRAWSSNECFRESMDALDVLYSKNTKSNNINERRKRLRELLLREQKEFEQELRQHRSASGRQMQEMKLRADDLKSAREERRKQLAEEKLYDHWRQNAPELREIESEKMKQHVVKSWADQAEDKRIKDFTTREEEHKVEAEMERQRLLLTERDKMLQEAKRKEEKEAARQLQIQMEELRIRQEEAAMLRQEQERLENEQLKVDEAEQKRRLFEEERKKKSFGRVLIQQHKAQMKRRSQEIQKALEMDLNILKNMAAKEEEELALKTTRREKAKADAYYMRQVLEEQLKLEKAREAELDMMYRDEAARMWQKRDAEWERERLARERLMKEVIDERKQQIETKMGKLRQRHEESLKNQEELLNEIEAVNRMTEREKKEEEEKRKARDKELKTQITERRRREMEMRIREQEKQENQRREELAYQQMLRREGERITERDMGQKSYRRRKIAFD